MEGIFNLIVNYTDHRGSSYKENENRDLVIPMPWEFFSKRLQQRFRTESFGKLKGAGSDSTTNPLESILSFQKDPIPSSLLKIDKDLNNKARQLFQLILKYTNATGAGPVLVDEQIRIVIRIYQYALGCPDIIDELFMQLVKQTCCNPNRACLHKTWELLSLCASAMTPQHETASSFLQYISSVALALNDDSQLVIQILAAYEFLEQSFFAGSRGSIPFLEEVEAILAGKKITIPVYFLDATHVDVCYNMSTTIAEVIKVLCKNINLSYCDTFGIFLCCKSLEPTKKDDASTDDYFLLDNKNYVGDILARFEQVKNSSESENLQIKFIFKKVLFLDSHNLVAEPAFVELSYIQAQDDYLKGNYPVGEGGGIQLAALQILADGSFVNTKSTLKSSVSVEHYIPKDLVPSSEKKEWEEAIMAYFSSIISLSKHDAKKQFLQILYNLSYGLSVFYNVQKITDPTQSLPDHVILGISQRGLLLFKAVPRVILHAVELHDIGPYGRKDSAFYFETEIKGSRSLFEFKTMQAEEICTIVQALIGIANRKQCQAHGKPLARGKLTGVEVIEELFCRMSKQVELCRKKVEEIAKSIEVKENTEKDMHKVFEGFLGSICQQIDLFVDDTDGDSSNKLQKALAGSLLKPKKESIPSDSSNDSSSEDAEDNAKMLASETQSSEERRSNDGSLLKPRKESIPSVNANDSSSEAVEDNAKTRAIETQSSAERSIPSEPRDSESMHQEDPIGAKKQLKDYEDKLSTAHSTIAFLNAQIRNMEASMEAKTSIKEKTERELQELHDFKEEASQEIAQLKQLYKKEQDLRKKYFNMCEDMKGKIRVYARWRPLIGEEIAVGDTPAIAAVDDTTLEYSWKNNKRALTFDKVFDEQSSQEDVFEDTQYLMQSAVDGYNVCIFAYGQTGSGKTFTIYGSDKNPGIQPRAVSYLFQLVKNEEINSSFTLKAYMLELYQDGLMDLLATDKTVKKLDVRKDSKGIVQVDNARLVQVNNAEELNKIIEKGIEKRHVTGTRMNKESSRSHLILSIFITKKNLRSGIESTGKLSFVDLAGSERVKKSGAAGESMREAQSINKSLSALGDVINALSAKEAHHVPYRNNKLTLLMSDSLGGNAKTLMFVNISPAQSNLDETHNSLTYASRVKCIKNEVNRNVASKEVMKMRHVISQLTAGRKFEEIDFEEIQDKNALSSKKWHQ